MVTYGELEAVEKRVADLERDVKFLHSCLPDTSELQQMQTDLGTVMLEMGKLGKATTEAVKMVRTVAEDMGALGRRVATLEVQPQMVDRQPEGL